MFHILIRFRIAKCLAARLEGRVSLGFEVTIRTDFIRTEVFGMRNRFSKSLVNGYLEAGNVMVDGTVTLS